MQKKTLEISTNVPCIIDLSILDLDQTVLESKSFDVRFDKDKMSEWLQSMKDKYLIDI